MATKKRTQTRAKSIVVAPEAPTVPISVDTPMVPVSSLQVGDQFEYEGERYRKLPRGTSKVAALHLTNPECGWIGVTGKAFEPDTLVIKK